jgi:hypothetical protein
VAPAFLAIAAFLAACGSKDIQNKEAVRQGILDHLAQNSGQNTIDVNRMDIEIVALTFGANEAHATASFRPKGSDKDLITVPYDLERKGNKWVVKPRTGGSSPHSAPSAPPPPSESPNLPPGHPPVGGKQ